MEMIERLRPFGITFEKSLEDLIKGIRANNNDQEKLAQFFDKSIQECKAELRTSDLDTKSGAILKLTYLEMYGFDASWCSFNILEVMASQKFQHKRIGYLAATQILQRQDNDDALMLMTNLLKKDLNSAHYVETSLAISGIATVVSKELAVDVCDDMSKLLTHSKPIIRKKAVLAMFKIFLKNPDSLRTYFDRIVDRLEDDDNAVVSATVNVICELAYMNPVNYIELAPRFFVMMMESSNNWMVIRLLKLFASLSLTEPRLKKKLLPEIKALIAKSKALSLQYECINAILNGNMLSPDDFETAEIVINKLLEFFKSNDQNLKYVGLLAFIKTCNIHESLIQKHSSIILTSICDVDSTIREKSLEIVDSLVTQKNIVAIVTRLTIQLLPYKQQCEQLELINSKITAMKKKKSNKNDKVLVADSEHNEDEDEDDEDENDGISEAFLIGSSQQPIVVTEKYKYLLINKIIDICSMNNYINIPSFKWYLGVLKDILNLNIINNIENVDLIVSKQLIDISLKVPSVRSELVTMCLEIIGVTKDTNKDLALFKNGLSNCVWIIGEYYDVYIQEDEDDSIDEEDENMAEKVSLIEIIDCISSQSVLETLGNTNFDDTILAYIHAIAKSFSKFCGIYGEGQWSESQFEFIKNVIIKVINWFIKFEHSPNFKVQESALSYIEVLRLVEESIEVQLESLKSSDTGYEYPPMFLTKGYSQLFSSCDMKPVNLKTQQKILPPAGFDFKKFDYDESVVEFQNLYNKLILEDLNLDYSDNEDDYEDGDNDISDSVSTDSNIEVDSTKIVNNHENDPYYISTVDVNNSSTTENENNTLIDVTVEKKPRKLSKPKKHKKEMIINFDAEDDEEAETTKTSIPEKSNSPFDSDFSALASVVLSKPENEVKQSFAQEYQTENSPYERTLDDDAQSKKDEIKIEVPIVEMKKKPKKKVKRKVAVIE